jgi:hypothetical protein
MTKPSFIECPFCGHQSREGSEQSGRIYNCTECGNPFTVPCQRKWGNPFAISSVVLALLGFIPLFSILAIACGIAALRKTKSPGVGLRKTAITGLVLGSLGTLTILPWEIYTLMDARYQSGLAVSGYNLFDIGQALLKYSNANDGYYPSDLGTLVKSENLSLDDFSMPLMPGASSAPPGPDQMAMTADQRVDWVNHHSDVIYLGAGLRRGKWGLPRETILLYEKHDQRSWPPNGSFWTREVLILDAECRVGVLPAAEAHRRIANQVSNPPSARP